MTAGIRLAADGEGLGRILLRKMNELIDTLYYTWWGGTLGVKLCGRICGPFPSNSCFLFVYIDWCLLTCLMTLDCLFLFEKEVLKYCMEALYAWDCQVMVFIELEGLGHLIRRNYKCHIYRSFLLERLKLQQ